MIFRKAPKPPLPPHYVPFYRRRFFIKKEFQGKFILFYILAVASVTGISTFLLHGQIKQVVERYLYSSHIKVAKTGDFLLDLMFKGNLWAMLAVVIVVLLLSLVVFRRLNRHFSRLEQKLLHFAASGPPSQPLPVSHFNAIAELNRLAHSTEEHFHLQHNEIRSIVVKLEAACAQKVDPEELGEIKRKLDSLLQDIQLPQTN